MVVTGMDRDWVAWQKYNVILKIFKYICTTTE